VTSPHAAALYHISDRVTGWAAVNSGFRAPTLNELYRQFRQGTTLVLANNTLGPERLVGGEAGINVAPVRNLSWRTTWFDNRVKNPVSNVTLSQVGANVTQQRQNLGRTRIWGVQTDVEYRLGTSWRFNGAYVYDEAKVTDGGAANLSLVGKFLPQVPKHRGSFQVAYVDPKYINVALGAQLIGRQFDDDQNARAVPTATLSDAGYKASTDPGLPGFALVDVTASRVLSRNIEVFVGAQNLFDKQYFVGTLPTTIGSPRLVNGGVRVRFSAR
jgi:outer membrane receptor protein involved in Fe transport